MKKPRTRSAMFFFADATSALMAGTFVLACALIRTDSSTAPPVTVNGLILIEIPMLSGEISDRINLTDYLKVHSVMCNGQQLRSKGSSGNLTMFSASQMIGQTNLKMNVFEDPGTIRIETEATDMIEPCTVIVEMQWDDEISPTPWPVSYQATAVGTAINPDAHQLLSQNIRSFSRDSVTPEMRTQLRVTMIFDPDRIDNIVFGELVGVRP